MRLARYGLGLLLVAAPGGDAAFAADAALLLGTDRYEQLGRLSRGAEILQVAPDLADLGFAVTSVRNARADTAADAVQSFLDAAADADRLLVVLSGRFATDGTRSWYLTADARAAGLFDLGDTAVSVESLLAVLARVPGQAVLVLASGSGEQDPIDPWLRDGIGAIAVPQGVTVLLGDPTAVTDFLTDEMTRPAADLARALAGNDEIAVAGFMPRSFVFMPGRVVDEETGPPPADNRADEALWLGSMALDTIDAYRTYLRRFPDGLHADAAEAAIAAIIAEPNRAQRLAEEALRLTRDARRDIQRDLSILGYDTRGIDGIFGTGSRRAIANWQQQNGYSQTTYLTAEQIARLDAQARVRAAALEAEAERRRLAEARADRAYWEETGALGTEAGFRAYVSRYPDGLYAEIAADALSLIEEENRAAAAAEDRAAWDLARTADSLESYLRYLRGHPDGAFKAEAEARITAITQETEDQGTIAEAQAQEAALGLNPVTIRLIESRLDRLGLEPGEVDGVLDNDARRALRRYQRARDLPATGYLNEATLVRLLADTLNTLGR